MSDNEFKKYKKLITGFNEVTKDKGLKINSKIKMEKDDLYVSQDGGDVTLVFFYKENNKNYSYPFLCDI